VEMSDEDRRSVNIRIALVRSVKTIC
jgi:hypothetical protein